MVGKILLRHNYILGSGLGAHGQGISRPIEIEEYKNRRGLGFCPSCHEIIESRKGKHLHRLAARYGKINRGVSVHLLSYFFHGPPHIVGGTLDGLFSDSDSEPVDLPNICVVTEETTPGAYIRLAQENEEPNNWTSVLRYSAELLEESRPIYFGEGLDEDGRVPEIEESLCCLENRQLTVVEPTEEINVGAKKEPRILKIGTGLDPTQRARMIEFLTDYQEIRMAEEDKVKTTFITMWGTFCYRVMSFGLKNAGATYQRAIVTLFHDMMHKEIEKYKLRLNLTKCTFGAKSGKLLGFVVSERGIEVDSDKVKAIRELRPPSSAREVRGFLGRLNYIARFIANLTDKFQPLFRLLRKNVAIEWDDECQKAFDTIKAYLAQPPVLVPPTPDRPLILYLTMYFDGAVNSTGSGIGVVLISPDGRHYPIIAKVNFPCTNNVAEYEACIIGLQAAIDFKVKELEVFGDSMLTFF
ncbi:hypothetical protein CRG98_003945 [Punica granatum]|uniref:G-patch domain-containing protein n=1 Tax=Punica granatum TaxID=22663 RepID=A0A2I0L4P9_PUNGR|nr:hypothetical protein CRG98_003945 [Punica granatum]